MLEKLPKRISTKDRAAAHALICWINLDGLRPHVIRDAMLDLHNNERYICLNFQRQHQPLWYVAHHVLQRIEYRCPIQNHRQEVVLAIVAQHFINEAKEAA